MNDALEVEIKAARDRLMELVSIQMEGTGVTAEQLAERVLMNPATIYQFLRGERAPDFRSVVRMLFSMGARLDIGSDDLAGPTRAE